MASTKDLFFKGLCYDFTTVTDLEQEIEEVKEALGYCNIKSAYYSKLLNQLEVAKENLYQAKEQMKRDVKYFGYTKEELQGKYKPRYITEEELAKDYEKDMKEVNETVDYNFKAILEQAKQLDIQKELQAVAC